MQHITFISDKTRAMNDALRHAKETIRRAVHRKKAESKAQEVARQKTLREEAKDISIEGFNTAINAAAHDARSGLTSFARDHLSVAEEIAGKLPPEQKESIDYGFTKLLNAVLEEAADDAYHGWATFIRPQLRFIKKVAKELPPEKRQVLNDGYERILKAALTDAQQDASSGYTLSIGSSLRLAKRMTRKLPGEKKQILNDGLTRVYNAAIGNAEIQAGDGYYMNSIGSALRNARRAKRRLPHSQRKKLADLSGVFYAAIRASEREANYGDITLAKSKRWLARRVKLRNTLHNVI